MENNVGKGTVQWSKALYKNYGFTESEQKVCLEKAINILGAYRYVVWSLSSEVDDFYFDAQEQANRQLSEALEQAERKKTQLELLGKIYAVLDTCTPKQRERFLMYTLENMTHREIAEVECIYLFAVQKSIVQVISKIEKNLNVDLQ